MQGLSNYLRLLAPALLVGFSINAARASEEIPAWAEESTAIYYKANAQGDAEALVEIYSREAIIYISPEDPGNSDGVAFAISGRDAIIEFFQEDFMNTRYDCEWKLTHVLKSEYLVAVAGRDTCIEINRTSDEQQVVASGEWVLHLQETRQRQVANHSGALLKEALIPKHMPRSPYGRDCVKTRRTSLRGGVADEAQNCRDGFWTHRVRPQGWRQDVDSQFIRFNDLWNASLRSR